RDPVFRSLVFDVFELANAGPHGARLYAPDVRPSVDVYKFGGAAVGNAEAPRIAGEHVRAAKSRVVAIVSAMYGVTDLLLDASRAALNGDRIAYEMAAEQFASKHREVVKTLLPDDRRLENEIEKSTSELRSMCDSISVLHELTPRAADALVARGERLV